jgi:ligand-binding sensor domain-containing protein
MRYILVVFVLATILPAQNFQDWQIYTQMNNIADIEVFDNRIWAASDGGIYSYQPDDGTHRKYSNLDGLASLKVTALESRNPDLIIAGTADGILHLYNLNDDNWLPKFDMEGEYIRDIQLYDDTLWVATDNGLGVYLIENNEFEFRDFYNNFPVSPIQASSVFVFEGRVFYGTVNGLLHASSNFIQQNLKISQNWQLLTAVNGLPSNIINDLEIFDSHLIIATNAGAAQLNEAIDLSLVEDWTWGHVKHIAVKNDTLHFFRSTDYLRKMEGYWQDAGFYSDPISAVVVDEQQDLWLGFTRGGLRRNDWTDAFYVSGPASNHVGNIIKDRKGDVWITSGKFGVTFQYGFYKFNGDEWTNYRFLGDPWPRKNYACAVYEDAAGRIWIGSWGGGVTIITDDDVYFYHAWPDTGQMIISSGEGEEIVDIPALSADKLDCLVGANVSGSNTYTVITSFTEDISQNMWLSNYLARLPKYITVINSSGNNPIPDCSEWAYFGDELGMSQEDGEISAMEFDVFGRLWIGTSNRGILRLDYNGTIENTNDDKLARFNMTNDHLFSNTILSIKEDRDQIIWVGTAGGLNSFQPDPSGLGNRFFPHVGETGPIENRINHIFVDNFNNKWFSTDGGMSILIADKSPFDPQAWVHYTPENSGLPDKIINSVYVDSKSGTAYIGTESGLAVFRGAFSEIREDFSLLSAGPNPFLVDGNREFVIKNLVPNANVKIMTINGRLVRELNLQNGFVKGSRAHWNGRDNDDRRVPSGIYLYLVFNEEGITQTGKISVVRP